MSGGFRLDKGGDIDRSRPLNFQFNGETLQGYAGDTLASALLANGVGTVARGFKYHRPRGIFAAGLDEPNAMLAVRDGHGYDPALRAGQVALREGLEVNSVTGWPSANFDAVSWLTQLTAPFMPAGFYYKTLKWPNWSWYENTIRNSTGFGSADGQADQRQREMRHEQCDVLIVGAGPAGLAAAKALTGADRSVILADLSAQPGGVLRYESAQIDGVDGAQWADNVVASFKQSGHRYLSNTTVSAAYEGNFFTLLETLRDSRGVVGERVWKLHAKAVILATGAHDRPMLFANNDRPGILLGQAVREFIGQYAAAPGRSIAIATNNDSAYLTALQAQANGLQTTLIDTREKPSSEHLAAIKAAGVTAHLGAHIEDTKGSQRIKQIKIRQGSNGTTQNVMCDALAVSGGFTPVVHLAAHRGSKPVYDERFGAFACPNLPKQWNAAGACTGKRNLADVIASGFEAAAAITTVTGEMPKVEVVLNMGSASAPAIAPTGKRNKMWVDLQNDVKVSDIELAARENYVSVEHLKRYTTLGMGTDQGRTSNINGLAILADRTGRSMNDVGTTTFRPPYSAVRMGAIAQHRQSESYQPKRLLPAHAFHEQHQAVFEDFGWQRPDWYKANGAERSAAMKVEMAAVREHVGLFDASPLGKIEIAGPDAREFINRFYVSNLATLKPGRIRYSVMCHDDGIVFDDGVVTCINDNLFLAGPTSGHAEMVAGHFERWHQTEWPELKVSITPVTSNWAAIAIAGPKARDLLQALEVDFDVSAEALPHMHYAEGKISGVPARIARVSFTGELQYEVSVPSRYAQALLERAMTLGEQYDARLVGMEAWLHLRLEKGYLHLGADTNGRTTPLDIGMGIVVAKKQTDFLGKRSLFLPFNQSEKREQLVGLKPVDGRIQIGGRILADGHTQVPCPSIGNVTSAGETPTVGNIGLAVIEAGFSRMGDTVHIYANGEVSTAEICSPVFYDPENQRLNA